MHEFFHGWRRKAGCALLIVVLALLGAWGRSWMILDRVVFNVFHRTQTIVTWNGRITWWGTSRLGSNTWQSYVPLPSESDVHGLPLVLDAYYEFAASKRPETVNPHIHFLTATYTWCISPLSMLSAYLILWKPRKP